MNKIIKFYPNRNAQGVFPYCSVCGIGSFAHQHRPGTLPKDFERIEDLNSSEKPNSSTFVDEMKEAYSRPENYAFERPQMLLRWAKDKLTSQPSEKVNKKCTWCGGNEWIEEKQANPESPLYCKKCGQNIAYPKVSKSGNPENSQEKPNSPFATPSVNEQEKAEKEILTDTQYNELADLADKFFDKIPNSEKGGKKCICICHKELSSKVSVHSTIVNLPCPNCTPQPESEGVEFEKCSHDDCLRDGAMRGCREREEIFLLENWKKELKKGYRIFSGESAGHYLDPIIFIDSLLQAQAQQIRREERERHKNCSCNL